MVEFQRFDVLKILQSIRGAPVRQQPHRPINGIGPALPNERGLRRCTVKNNGVEPQRKAGPMSKVTRAYESRRCKLTGAQCGRSRRAPLPT
jgi:hypothetical protein